MKKIISACGNDCNQCPRHLPKSKEQLQSTAELWYKIGYRDRVVSSEEISCIGCSMDNWCRYNIIGCVTEKSVSNCGECCEYPCSKIEECFKVTASFEPDCKKSCTDEEYRQLKRASFEKKENLDLIARLRKFE